MTVLPLTAALEISRRVHAVALGHLADQAVDRAEHALAEFLQALRGCGRS